MLQKVLSSCSKVCTTGFKVVSQWKEVYRGRNHKLVNNILIIKIYYKHNMSFKPHFNGLLGQPGEDTLSRGLSYCSSKRSIQSDFT